MMLDYEITSENTAKIYGKISVSELVRALDKENCELISLREQDENLEAYFINLVGGEKDA